MRVSTVRVDLSRLRRVRQARLTDLSEEARRVLRAYARARVFRRISFGVGLTIGAGGLLGWLERFDIEKRLIRRVEARGPLREGLPDVLGTYRLRQGCVAPGLLQLSFLPLAVIRVSGKAVKRSYVCSSSLADRLGAAGRGLAVVSCDRPAPGPARLMPTASGACPGVLDG